MFTTYWITIATTGGGCQETDLQQDTQISRRPRTTSYRPLRHRPQDQQPDALSQEGAPIKIRRYSDAGKCGQSRRDIH